MYRVGERGSGERGRYRTITSQYLADESSVYYLLETNAGLPLHPLRCNGSRIAFNKINSIFSLPSVRRRGSRSS